MRICKLFFVAGVHDAMSHQYAPSQVPPPPPWSPAEQQAARDFVQQFWTNRRKPPPALSPEERQAAKAAKRQRRKMNAKQGEETPSPGPTPRAEGPGSPSSRVVPDLEARGAGTGAASSQQDGPGSCLQPSDAKAAGPAAPTLTDHGRTLKVAGPAAPGLLGVAAARVARRF